MAILFMNEYEIDEAARCYADDPVVGTVDSPLGCGCRRFDITTFVDRRFFAAIFFKVPFFKDFSPHTSLPFPGVNPWPMNRNLLKLPLCLQP